MPAQAMSAGEVTRMVNRLQEQQKQNRETILRLRLLQASCLAQVKREGQKKKEQKKKKKEAKNR